MGAEIAALGSLLGLTSAFALIGTAFAAWMAWRIVEKAGLPGWAGLGAVLITLTGIGTVVPLVLLWVFAFMRWPRDGSAFASPVVPLNAQLSPPPRSLPAPSAIARGWRLAGGGHTLVADASSASWLVTGGPAGKPGELSLPDPSIGQPHARLLVAGERLGLEDLGSPGGTLIDGARLLPEHGPRDISAARTLRFGTIELALSRS